MMKPMQKPQMQSQMGGAGMPEMSEEELKKLAMLLQQMPANEGLMSGTPTEQGKLEENLGPGNPLPGTEGLGPAGGMVKSYAKDAEDEDGRIDEDHRIAVLTDAEVAALNYLKHQDKEQGFPSGNGPMIQALASMNTHDLDYLKYKGMEIPTLNDGGRDDSGDSSGQQSGGGSENTSQHGGGGGGSSSRSYSGGRTGSNNSASSGASRMSSSAPQTGGGDPRDRGGSRFQGGGSVQGGRGEGAQNYGPQGSSYDQRFAANEAYQRSQGGGGGGGGYRPPPPPRKYPDMNGKEWNTQAEADASNAKIKAAMKGLEDRALTTDSTIKRFLAKNKDSEELKGLTDEQIKTAYETAKTKSIEASETQVPAMVETMNAFMQSEDGGPEKTFEDFKATLGENLPPNLSEGTLMDMYANAVGKKKRGDAFTLTKDEVTEFSRDAVVTEDVVDAEAAKIGEIGEATDTEVGDVTDVTPTEVEAIKDVTDQDLDAIFAGGADKAEQLLLDRIEGKATSPAEQQLKRTSEANLRMLLGATAGGDADPAKVRQLKNTWQDMTQFAVGEAADLRSQESMAAEQQLIELYKDKDTKKLNTKLANMEKEKQMAMKNGDLALAGKLANQSTMLSKVITQANLTKDTKLANLETMKQKMIEQGKMDMATNIANLQKNVTLAQTDAELAVQSRAMDDAVAMNAYKGQQALYGLEAEMDIESTKNDLTTMGFDLQRDLAELDAATQREVAGMTRDWRKAQGNDQKQAAIYQAIGAAIGAWAASDVRAKTSISPGAGEVESFLDALNSYKYEYKEPAGDQSGMFVGVMAQDLEKSPMGASFVKDTPKGKMVDYGHGLAAILASQANLHHRIRDLEEG